MATDPAVPPGELEEPDVDEPPDDYITFSRKPLHFETPDYQRLDAGNTPQLDRKASLLTQALTSPNLKCLSEGTKSAPDAQSATSALSAESVTSTAELTSDGNLTTPPRSATPSPPLPYAQPFSLLPLTMKEPAKEHYPALGILTPPQHLELKTHEPEVKEEQPKKRCIKFACPWPQEKREENPIQTPKEAPPLRRPCALRFACPLKPSREEAPVTPPSENKLEVSDIQEDNATPRGPSRTQSNDSSRRAPMPIEKTKKVVESEQQSQLSKQQIREKQNRTANGSKLDDEEWTDVEPNARGKLTVTDVMRKENLIRKLGEEVEEEAKLEDEEKGSGDDEDEDEDEDEEEDEDGDNELEDDEDDQLASESSLLDDGNESDNEEGFAESDDDSTYEFWVPRPAATLGGDGQPEVMQPLRRRAQTDSSVDSITDTESINTSRRAPRCHRVGRMQPHTPELPDSTDFVCGTLDEDRPLEAAYVSCMEQRRLAKHQAVPQDVDPSFPTDEPDDDSDGEDQPVTAVRSPQTAGSTDQHSVVESDRSRLRHRSPAPSPRRMRSPAPVKRTKSPAPAACRRRAAAYAQRSSNLFGRSPHPRRSPPPTHPVSPACSPSKRVSTAAVDVPRLAQRPDPLHIKSLPRTPNPFWREHHRHARRRQHQRAAEPSRGPIDIVQGMEARNRRRREKEWRLHGRHVAAQRERIRGLPQVPGRGAERMREVGLKCQGYGAQIQLMLSV